MGALRSNSEVDEEGPLCAPILRRALGAAGFILLLSLVLTYMAWKQDDPNELNLAESVIRLSMVP